MTVSLPCRSALRFCRSAVWTTPVGKCGPHSGPYKLSISHQPSAINHSAQNPHPFCGAALRITSACLTAVA
jgi:hypothetical protein